jgi:hypothetical protein
MLIMLNSLLLNTFYRCKVLITSNLYQMTTYTQKITLPTDNLQPIPDDKTGAQQLEEQLANSKVLYTLILDYEYGKGNLQNVALERNSLCFTTANTGTMKVTYDINEFSVCSALDYTGAYSMILNFNLDTATNEISLTGEERYE